MAKPLNSPPHVTIRDVPGIAQVTGRPSAGHRPIRSLQNRIERFANSRADGCLEDPLASVFEKNVTIHKKRTICKKTSKTTSKTRKQTALPETTKVV